MPFLKRSTHQGRRFAGGVDRSGGQWQKVALARAYMRGAQLLILDDPTAALDARAEFEVFARFSELMGGRLAVLIPSQQVRPEFPADSSALVGNSLACGCE